MSEQPLEDGDEGAEEDETTERTKIEVSVGNLSIKVENHDREACEAQFKRIYDFVLDDVADWSRAMDSVVTQEGGFR